MELFRGNSQCVKPIDCFRKGAPSMMFDGFLNVTLCEEVSTTGVTQENLEIPLSPFFLSFLFIYLFIYIFSIYLTLAIKICN